MIPPRISFSIILACLFVGCSDSGPSPVITEETPASQKVPLPPELDFFNSLRGKLAVEFTEPPQRMRNLANEKASATAKIISVRLALEVDDKKQDQVRPLTQEELNDVAFTKPEIRLKGQGGEPILHKAPNGKHFRVQDLMLAVEETERRTRGESKWFGGIDVHHIFFEGIHPIAGDVWEISWGS